MFPENDTRWVKEINVATKQDGYKLLLSKIALPENNKRKEL